jgi:hypothetical protein
MKVQIVTFQLDGIDGAAYGTVCDELAPTFAAVPDSGHAWQPAGRGVRLSRITRYGDSASDRRRPSGHARATRSRDSWPVSHGRDNSRLSAVPAPMSVRSHVGRVRAPCHYQAGDRAGADWPTDPPVEGLVLGGESVALSG